MKKFLLITIVLVTSLASYAQEYLSSTIILVRHAEKANDGTKNPPLSDIGIERAKKLNELLKNTKIDIIYSTPYKRTQATVSAIAETHSLEIQEYSPFDEEFINSLKLAEGKTILVSGHSNTTPAIANALLGKQKFKDFEHEEYGRILIVTLHDGNPNVLELNY